ncbi:MAG TPA: RsbRD N-terminal domain-containing protein [Pyrinomonadaceae bacterium]|nr:RsbRD N-terminal domain-containing protein [Pyrinomonadaceae bacterium]
MAQPDAATLIEENIGHLVEIWVKAVRSDRTIKSDSDLSEGGLIDHVPVLLEEICGVLRSGERPSIENIHEARVHAYTRFRQGYRARDLVRETSLLRMLILDYLSKSLVNGSEHSVMELFIAASRTINLYIDEELRYAVSIYMESSSASR